MLEETQIAEAQEALDELFVERLIPFELSAHKVVAIGGEEYIVRFHDNRLPAVDISWCQGESFKDVLRVAVLARVKRLSSSAFWKPAPDQSNTVQLKESA